MNEQQKIEVEDILVDAKALKRCWMHPDEVFDCGVWDLVPAYMLANSKFSRGEVHAFRDRREMTDTMMVVHKEAAIECWPCEKLKDD
jgi:hypothetical protein